MKHFKSDEELKEFMEYFKNTLPNPKHHPIKMMWLVDWWFTMIKGEEKDANIHFQKQQDG